MAGGSPTKKAKSEVAGHSVSSSNVVPGPLSMPSDLTTAVAAAAQDGSGHQGKNTLIVPSILQRVGMKTMQADHTVAEPRMVNLAEAFYSSATARLQGLETLQTTSRSLINMSTADADALQVKSGYITHRDAPQTTRFFLVGMTTHSSLFRGANARSISVAFSDRTFPRAMAVAGAKLGCKDLFVPSFQDRVSVSTYKRKTDKVSPDSPVKSKLGPPSPSKAAGNSKLTFGPPVLQWDEDIPCFDGREPFKVTKYQGLPSISEELSAGSAVIVIFTVGSYLRGLDTVLSLNLQGVILLRGADDTRGPFPCLPALWVTEEDTEVLEEDSDGEVQEL
ncbi:hypothetical protein FPV67DRAFT_1675696 [Lyophyllum atratum]|nr:hypothetical protein FPV67DRAFT_1675696 [Lyophyllum atratum]